VVKVTVKLAKIKRSLNKALLAIRKADEVIKTIDSSLSPVSCKTPQIKIKKDSFTKNSLTVEAAEYQGRTVKLNKPMKGDRKKYKVYVKNDKGNVVKVEFGDPKMDIKRDDPKRRKSFRARHRCDDPGPKDKARYWSCKMWSSKPVSEILKGK